MSHHWDTLFFWPKSDSLKTILPLLVLMNSSKQILWLSTGFMGRKAAFLFWEEPAAHSLLVYSTKVYVSLDFYV